MEHIDEFGNAAEETPPIFYYSYKGIHCRMWGWVFDRKRIEEMRRLHKDQEFREYPDFERWDLSRKAAE